jgi:hypothetical protein
MMQWNLLTATLTANSVFSGLSGLALIIGAAPASTWLGIAPWFSAALGVGLVGFSIQVAMTARNPEPQAVWMVIAGDVAWVVIAAAAIVAFPESMSAEGIKALAVVTAGVSTFACLQWVGLRAVIRSDADNAVTVQ